MTLQTQTWLLLATASMATLLAGAAAAQTADANASSFNAGYGRSPGQDNNWRNTAARDQNGNRLIVDGVIQSGDSYSSSSRRGGAWDNMSGAGVLGGATAIGNSLNVVVQGNRNTVIVNSTQTNNGNVTAGVNVTPPPVVTTTGAPPTSGTSGGPAGTSPTPSTPTTSTPSPLTPSPLTPTPGVDGTQGLVLNGFDARNTNGVGSTTLNGEINLDDSGI